MRVEQVQVVSAFTLDEQVVLNRGGQVAEIARVLGAEATPLNVPDRAPPELPRIIVKLGDALVGVGLNRCELRLSPPDHIRGDFDDAMTYVQERWTPVLKGIATPETFEWSGAVVDLETSVPLEAARTGARAAHPAFANLTTLKWSEDELTTFQLQVGRRVGNFNRNYTVSGFETRQIEVSAPPGSRSLLVNAEVGTLIDLGVKVILDINSRPARVHDDPIDDAQTVFDELRRASNTLADDLNLAGIL